MNKYGFDALKDMYVEALKSGKGIVTECTLDGYIKIYTVTMMSALFPDAPSEDDDITEAWELVGYLRPQ